MTKLTVKCSDEEIQAWREAAWDQRLSLSAWVRTRLNGGTLAAGGGDVPEPGLRTPTGDNVGSNPTVAPSAASASKCSRAARHHINHSGKPCPECGYPKEQEG